ncbi:type IX secretion system sortase PorU [uncultured Aquimarina sp.]|uniref:type IX secretion system sortase PorU n=1 Tax=uncultured Aquimarina sp. TaxID=575652 RepID=UPI0026208601|nr:type IX secretion system sortase PorU [uncultured Aquimarina sp.]
MKRSILLCCIPLLSTFFYGNQSQLISEKRKDTTEQIVKKIPLSRSVLARGDWYKFYIEKTGIYKLTPEFLSSLGIDVTTIDPTTIKIYGNGGHMLPLKNSKNTEFDLKENAVKVVGGEDGMLSEDDYILFYGQGTKAYNRDSKTHINVYDDESYYFITTSGKKGRRVVNSESFNKKADTTITTFEEDQFYEMDQYNIGMMGRRWLGDKIENNEEKQFSFYFPNKSDGTAITYTIVAVAKSHKPSKLKVRLNQKEVGEIKFRSISDRLIGIEGSLEKTIKNHADSIKISVRYEVEDKKALGKSYLDYIRVSAERLLVGSDKQLKFTIPNDNSKHEIGRIELKKTKNISEVWDVTNPEMIRFFENTTFSNKFSFKIQLDTKRKFVAVTNTDFYEPLKPIQSIVENQDLKGTIFLDKENNFKNVDYVIITQKDMVTAAERLADFHRTQNKMNVKVVLVQKIYNEFSSGKQDIGAIRNFIRYVYENASDDSKKLSYVCFMGNATVDYKQILNNTSLLSTYKKNVIPSFMSYESFSKTRSYVSDDFFAMMDPEEGEMKSTDELDIVLGRILVDTDIMANDVVNKFIRYYQESSFGDWRNNILLLSDDVDEVWEQGIQRNLDNLGNSLIKKYPFLNISKVYSDAYIQKSTSGGEQYPDVTKALIKKIEKGVAVLDYFGHAEEEGFGTEFFFTKKDAINLKNKDKLPLFITVTCLATRFDNPFDISVGEHVFRNPNGGAIAMIATTREIFMNAGVRINNKIMKTLFLENGPYLKPAETVLKLKNELRYQDKRSVFFIGDPAMSLQMPRPGIRITKINDIPLQKFRDTMKALNKIRIAGQLVDTLQNVKKNYDGEVFIKIFDKKTNKKTLGNNNIRNRKGNLIQLEYKDQDLIIYSGNFDIKKGVFDFEFVVPKDIDMSIGNCKISLYAKMNNVSEDAVGVCENILLGGMSNIRLPDTKGPEIEVFINDEKSKAINIVTANPELKIELADQNGINLSRMGIGHQMKMIIDGKEKEEVMLNDFFTNKENSYRKGSISYILKTLSLGYHTLEIKIWDTFNNSSTKKIEVVVLDSL